MSHRRTLLFDVFGKRLALERVQGAWQAAWIGADGKHRPAGPLVPGHVDERELAQYLDDLCHESATPAHPAVRRIDAQSA